MHNRRVVSAAMSALAIAVLFLAGLPARHALAQADMVKIKTIALIPCPEPVEFVALTKQSGLIWLIINSENAEKLTAAMARDPGNLGERITDAVEAQLRAENYEVVRVRASRDKPHRLLETYATIATDADAILDIVVTQAGYYRPALIYDFAPGVRIDTRLVAADTQQKIFNEDFAYARANRWSDQEKFDPLYKFANLDRVRDHLAVAKEGLAKGAEPLADELVAKVNEARDGKIRPSSEAEKTSSDPAARTGPASDSTR